MEQLAKALREEMERRNHSLRTAAGILGVSSGTVNNWSKGWVEMAPRPEHWKTLADYIGVPVFVILGWLGFLTDEEVESVRAIPGYLKEADAAALVMVQDRLFLVSA